MTTDKSKNFFRVSAEDFKKIPGSPIAYWADKYKNIFEKASLLADIIKPRQGLATGCNDLFLRQWSEISISAISFNSNSRTDALRSALRWFPYNKGGIGENGLAITNMSLIGKLMEIEFVILKMI